MSGGPPGNSDAVSGSGKASPELRAGGGEDAGGIDTSPLPTDPSAPSTPRADAPPPTGPAPETRQPAPRDQVPAPQTPAPRDPADPMSPEYNPYLVEGDPAYVTEDTRRQWLGQQEVVRQCMRDAGFEYLDWQWWEEGNPMPAGLSTGAQEAWFAAFRGEAGCEAVGARVAQEASDAGTPLSEPLPEADPAAPTPRERWLAFQDAVRSCMADAGLEYRYWEYWNPAYPSTDGTPAMPEGLGDAERSNWNLTAFGSAEDPGAAVPTDGGGCWATGATAVDFRPFA